MFDKGGNYTYKDAGFDGFFNRSLSSRGGANTLQGMTGRSRRAIAFDSSLVSGGLGDSLTIGRINLDGKSGRITVDDGRNNETLRIGDLGNV